MKKVLLLILALTIAVGLYIFRTSPTPKPLIVKTVISPPPIYKTVSIVRPLYPFSIHTGGVRSLVEFRDLLLSDPKIFQHFSGFSLASARFEQLAKPECAFVSFRKDGLIRWTKQCIQIPAGELILTDGKIRILARCANRISNTPEVPTESVDLKALITPQVTVIPPPDGTLFTSMFPPDFTVQPPPSVTKPPIPFAPPIYPPPICVTCGPKKPPTSVPEPRSITMFGVMTAAAILAATRSKRWVQ